MTLPEGGMELALSEEIRGAPCKLSDKETALLVEFRRMDTSAGRWIFWPAR